MPCKQFRLLPLVAIVISALGGLWVSACDSGTDPADQRPVVVVSIPPQAYLIERMTGGRVNVKTMVGSGRSPEEFQPLPQQLAAIDGARYYFAVGLPFEQAWLAKLAEAHPDTEIISIPLGELAGGDDPHYWTSPRNAIRLAEAAHDPLMSLLPGGREVFANQYQALIDELEILDARIQTLMAEQTRRRFLVYHPAWSHFASRYGLEQVAYEQDGKQPGARYLTDLLALCRANAVHSIFVQPQSPPGQVRRFAAELGATQVLIDPLQYDYTKNLWDVAQKIAGGLW